MINTDITKQPLLKNEYLDPNQYTLALLKEGYRTGLIAQGELDDIQNQIMALLAESIVRYTGGESTSLKEETAQRIMMSMLYAIDAFLKSLGAPEDAIAAITADPIKDSYVKGLGLLEVTFEDTKQLYHEIRQNKLDIPIEAYHMTIDELAQFFNHYDMRFNAQDTIASIDYPLLFDDMQVQGVFYIKQYLEKLALETEFCRLFPSGDIKKLLFNYDRVYRVNYRESLINIFEIVLNNAVFSVMSGGSADVLGITRYQCKYLADMFKAMDYRQCSARISASIGALLGELHIDKPALRAYILRFKTLLIPQLLNALQNESLEHLVILDEPEASQDNYIFDAGKSMDDDSFRSLLNHVTDCNDTNEKIQLIMASIESLGDFIDLLEADFLYGDEYRALFSSLGDIELSVLAGIVFMEEIRSDPRTFTLPSCQEISREMPWQHEYAAFLKELGRDRLNAIENILRGRTF
ncbi:MAG: DUF6179 domain-containing protein [Syntrophomonadaceae bacterium]|nr:DUF6179 domain-containing protein [Syntrophomonadaceae bacterium]